MSPKSPVAECIKCGRTTDDWSLINKRCLFRGEKTGRCTGTYKSKLTPEDARNKLASNE